MVRLRSPEVPKFISRLLLNQQGVIPLVVIVAVGIIGSSGVTVAASQKSIPGDALYPVKKVTENVRVAAAISKKDKAKVHLDIAEEKVKEIEKLEEKGKTEKIAETAQNLEDSQDQALELTETIKSEGENVDELAERLEVQTKRQQLVFTKISPKIPVQVGESLRKSLEQFRKEVEVVVESDDDEEEAEEEDSGQEEADQGETTPNQTPCPSPSSSEDENNYQEYEDTSNEDDEEKEEWKRYQYYEDEDVRGISQLRNSQGSSFGSDPCDGAEGSSAAGSQTFDGGAGTGEFEDSAPESPSDRGSSYEEPTSSSPDVEGVSAKGGLLQLILNALFPSQK